MNADDLDPPKLAMDNTRAEVDIWRRRS